VTHQNPHAAIAPSSSRMLAGYLTDIEQLLDEQRWDAALREASDLPRIAVALSDPELCCSGEAVGMWCREWIKPLGDAEHAPVAPATHHEPKRVPTRALRRLQLRRHVRTPPRGFAVPESGQLDGQESRSVEAGRALVGAARRWYARSGCHDATVQANLARLAVLR
jgi:hypothetical protein